MPILYACGCKSDGEWLSDKCGKHLTAKTPKDITICAPPVVNGTRVKILLSGSNKWIWKYAYRDDKEAEFYREWLDKKFELNAPFYILELEVE